MPSEKASFDPEKDKEMKSNPPPARGVVLAQRSCELSVERLENKVAFGMVYPYEHNLTDLVHGVDIPIGHQCVSVDGLIKPDALLPAETRGDDIMTVRDALGSFLAWPEELISYTNIADLKAQFLQAKPGAKVPKGFKLLYKHVITWMKTTGVSIQVRCEPNVFGHEKTIYLLHENVVSLLEFEMLGQAVVASYMAHLHSEIREIPELEETFTFIDPGSTYHVNADFEAYILNRLREGNPDRLFFLPHNQNMHWILVVIWEGEIYILNPLPHPTQFSELEKALSRALKSYNSETGRGNKMGKAKFLSGSPKQPGGIECAYVIMRYMKEIIDDDRLNFTKKWLAKTRSCYSIE
ncbi:uncharacterized protein LOC141686337 [Apium graveolens]|uniref:uncharacterized protein LOC141686337 n=1 Tax=Apium graveolens TaxID=4045 RepID=UPI003D7BA46A